MTKRPILIMSDIARVCHNVNRALCESFGDHSQKSWEEAEPWQRESAENGVLFRYNNQDASESAQHDAWMDDKLAAGWRYGLVKDAEKKTHPCLVPYAQLPPEQRAKDACFCAVVDSLMS